MNFRYKEFNRHKFESHFLALHEVLPKSNVLDVGCATGYIAKELNKKNCNVWGVEIDRNAANKAKKYLEDVYVGDIAAIRTFGIKKHSFDYILLLDVIEHIVDIEPTLILLKEYMAKNGKIILSTPNIAHISPRSSLLAGKFIYTEIGIMDKTHVHFYTRQTLSDLLNKCDYRIEKIDYSADFGQIPFAGRFLKHIPKVLQYSLTKLFPMLLAVQFIVVCS